MDCLTGLQQIDSESVDVIVTSPPYNIGKPYRSYHDIRPRTEYLDWMENVAVACKTALKKNGSFFLNMGGKPTDLWIALYLRLILTRIPAKCYNFTIVSSIHKNFIMPAISYTR